MRIVFSHAAQEGNSKQFTKANFMFGFFYHETALGLPKINGEIFGIVQTDAGNSVPDRACLNGI